MKRIVIGLCVVLLLAGVSFGQGNMGVSVMGGLTFPMGDFGDLYGTGFGLNGVFQYYINPALAITGTTGFMRWSDSITFFGEKLTISTTSIPLLGGVRYYLMPGDLSPYAGAELGLHILSTGVSGFGESESESEVEFGFGFGGGVLYALNPNLYLDANLKYNSISGEGSSLNFLGLFVGVYIHL